MSMEVFKSNYVYNYQGLQVIYIFQLSINNQEGQSLENGQFILSISQYYI